MYQHILLAVALQPGDEPSPHASAARQAAVALAKGSGAKLAVLSVYDYGELTAPSLPPEEAGRYRESQMQRVDAEMEMKMKAFLAGVQARELDLTPLLKVGEPRQAIVRTAEERRVDLLVIGAHSKRGLLDVLLGGTAAYVSRHAPCPVVMVEPRQPRPIPRTEEAAASPHPSA
jgi:nucleotide-binding universal stress UspA family protein